MAEKLASLRKKGGKMSETVLWTNASPTDAFGNVTITLSKSHQNFKQILFRIRVSNTDATTMDYIVKADEFANSVVGTLALVPMFGMYYNNQFWYRQAFNTDNTHIIFSSCIQGTTANNYACIPTKIIGLK